MSSLFALCYPVYVQMPYAILSPCTMCDNSISYFNATYIFSVLAHSKLRRVRSFNKNKALHVTPCDPLVFSQWLWINISNRIVTFISNRASNRMCCSLVSLCLVFCRIKSYSAIQSGKVGQVKLILQWN
jgi:hypothetical protein